jgi:branched-chain amino acid transport system substrate-binding protein
MTPHALRPRSTLVASALVLVLGLAGCGGGGGGGAAAGGGGGGGTILVGEFGSMTGSEATFGQSTDNGIRLAVKEINEAGGINGKKIEVKVYDDQGKSQEAGTAVTRLITDDKVVAVLGEVASSLSLAGGRVAQQYGVPMITPSSTNPAVTEIGDMIFRVCFLDPFQGWVEAKFARETLKAQKAAILYDQGQAYSKGLAEYFEKSFTEMGGTITTKQAFTGGDQDFSAQLTTIRETKPDVILVPGYYTDAGNVAIQVRKLGLTAPLLGGDGWDSAQLVAIGKEAIEGSYFSNHYSFQEKRPEVQNFVTKFQADYHYIPDGLAALGYDAARLLFDAMKRSPSLDGKALAKAIAETKDFPGVTGKITIDAGRNAKKSAVVVEVKGGLPVYVTTIEPQ